MLDTQKQLHCNSFTPGHKQEQGGADPGSWPHGGQSPSPRSPPEIRHRARPVPLSLNLSPVCSSAAPSTHAPGRAPNPLSPQAEVPLGQVLQGTKDPLIKKSSKETDVCFPTHPQGVACQAPSPPCTLVSPQTPQPEGTSALPLEAVCPTRLGWGALGFKNSCNDDFRNVLPTPQ